jgi:hypothetical protein
MEKSASGLAESIPDVAASNDPVAESIPAIADFIFAVGEGSAAVADVFPSQADCISATAKCNGSCGQSPALSRRAYRRNTFKGSFPQVSKSFSATCYSVANLFTL